jgi:hypothetical protein
MIFKSARRCPPVKTPGLLLHVLHFACALEGITKQISHGDTQRIADRLSVTAGEAMEENAAVLNLLDA